MRSGVIKTQSKWTNTIHGKLVELLLVSRADNMVAFPGTLSSGRLDVGTSFDRAQKKTPAAADESKTASNDEVASAELASNNPSSALQQTQQALASGSETARSTVSLGQPSDADNNQNLSDRRRETEAVERRLNSQSEQQRSRIERENSRRSTEGFESRRDDNEPSRSSERREDAEAIRAERAERKENAEASKEERSAISRPDTPVNEVSEEDQPTVLPREDTPEIREPDLEDPAQSFGTLKEDEVSDAELQQELAAEAREANRDQSQAQEASKVDDGANFSQVNEDELLGTNLNVVA